ncbi:hypothetical protein QQ054_01040 [Oscillatoria amoena NRMC-F 0135]|nr:hypothetical protein [Oscillatoria amoena NRMC-F 0135]
MGKLILNTLIVVVIVGVVVIVYNSLTAKETTTLANGKTVTRTRLKTKRLGKPLRRNRSILN